MFEGLVAGPQWAVSRDDLRAVEAAYGLTVEGDGLRALGGATNGVARFASDRGPLVLRVHRPWTTPARLSSVHRVQRRLRDAGVPAPLPIPTRTGETWTALHGRLAEVMEYVESDGPADTRRRMETACGTLARLHALLAAVPPEALVPPAYSSYATPSQALGMLEETDRAFAAYAGHEAYAQAAAVREAARGLLRTLEAERRTYDAALPRLFIHGDFGVGNVLMRGDAVVAVLDFDSMAHRERVFDLAYTAFWTLCRFSAAARAGAPAPDDVARVAGLVRSYQAAGSIPLAERGVRALPFEMARVPTYYVAEAGYLGREAYTAGPIGQTLAFGPHLSLARWLADNAPALSSQLAAALSRPVRRVHQ